MLEMVAVLPPQAELWLLEALAPNASDPARRVSRVGHAACTARTASTSATNSRESRSKIRYRQVFARLPHGSALEALAEAPEGAPDMARLAHHAEAAGNVDAVLRFAPAAADNAASLGAYREAADHYARALRFAQRLTPARRAELLEARAHACYLTDQNPEAIAALRAALDCHRALGATRAEGNTLRVLSQYLWCPGMTVESEEAGRESVRLLEQLEPGRELGLAYSHMAFLARGDARRDDTLLWAKRALESAEQLDDVELFIFGLRGPWSRRPGYGGLHHAREPHPGAAARRGAQPR